jgi:glycosyltransferase involved in cell wall biosynthesis
MDLPDTQRLKLSAFIITLNEERRIKDCLESLSFCDEIVVVDSFSTDQTRKIAESYNAKVIKREWTNFRDQKNFALMQCNNEWVLLIDADERVSSELRANIERVLQNGQTQNQAHQVVGYELHRVVFFLGRWWRGTGWRDEYVLRFFRKDKVSWSDATVHEKLIPHGKVNRMSGELHHYSFDNISDQVQKLFRYAKLAAQEYKGPRVGFTKLITSPFSRFFKFYFINRGILAGIAGFVVAINEAFYTFLKYAIVWEIQRGKEK